MENWRLSQFNLLFSQVDFYSRLELLMTAYSCLNDVQIIDPGLIVSVSYPGERTFSASSQARTTCSFHLKKGIHETTHPNYRITANCCPILTLCLSPLRPLWTNLESPYHLLSFKAFRLKAYMILFPENACSTRLKNNLSFLETHCEHGKESSSLNLV